MLWFLALVSIAWIAAIHGIAFAIFGVSAAAACAIVLGLATTFGGIVAFFAHEYRNAVDLSDDTDEQPFHGPLQDANLLMLSRSSHNHHPTYRRTRVRLSGSHPAADRLASLHRPPHFDRRLRKSIHPAPHLVSPLDFKKRLGNSAPSVN